MNATHMESREILVNGRRMHAQVSNGTVPGDRPPIVLVHGLVVAGDYMLPVANCLQSDFQVFVPDLPGFGRSDKPSEVLDVPDLADALIAWITAAGLEKAALLGNSFGCQISVDAAMRYPDRVVALVLAGPTVDPKSRSMTQQVARWMFNVLNEPPSLGPILVRDYWSAGVKRTIRTLQYCINDQIEQKLPHIRMPALVVRGSLDPLVPERWAGEAVEMLPRGQLAVIPGVGHTLNYNAPLELARVTRLFLTKLETEMQEEGTHESTLSEAN